MIVDKAPVSTISQTTATNLAPPSPHDATLGPLADDMNLTGAPGQSLRLSGNDHPDYAPPPYETATAVAPPRTSSIWRMSKNPAPYSTDYLGNLGSVADQEKPRICPRTPEEHTSPCFLRPISASSNSTSYQRLPSPFVIDSKPDASTLEDSFAITGTPGLYKHDVLESDWEELLGDVRLCARLSNGQQTLSNALPVTKHFGPPGYLASLLADKGIKRRKLADIGSLLNVWNERFFKPRQLEVILCRGDERKSGKDVAFLAPDRVSGPAAVVPRKRGGCCKRSRCCRSQKQRTVDEPYRLVVVSI